jgi:hypothetical protein
MSRISRYQESISRFIKLKSPYSEIIKINNDNDTLLNINEHEIAIMLLTIFNGQKKKRKFKSHESYNIAAGVDLMINTIMINDSINYYKNTYGEPKIKNFTSQAPLYVLECLTKNLETLENIMEKDKVHKLQNKIYSYFNKKMLGAVRYDDVKGIEHVHRTDIIKYNFNNKNIIALKYKKLKVIDKDILIDYVERTYGATCQCAFVLGWLLGGGEEKQINNFERLGTHFGLMIKLTNDFKNLERDIMSADGYSFNLIINCGIHECFVLFDESKLKLLEGCFTLDIYNTTIKEVIDHIEKNFDNCLKNADLELNSRYTSFSAFT